MILAAPPVSLQCGVAVAGLWLSMGRRLSLNAPPGSARQPADTQVRGCALMMGARWARENIMMSGTSE